MKQIIKKLVLLVLVATLGLVPGVSARAEDPNIVAINGVPLVLPDDSEDFTFALDLDDFEDGARNKLLGQSLYRNCLITFSVPELENLDAEDIENYSFNAPNPEAQKKRLLMVTLEYFEALPGQDLATSYLYVFNPDETPQVELLFMGDIVWVRMIPCVAEVVMYSKCGTNSKLWTDDWTEGTTQTAVYKSYSAGISNYIGHGWFYQDVDDVTFSYDYVDLPIDMQKYLKEYLFDYNEYLGRME